MTIVVSPQLCTADSNSRTHAAIKRSPLRADSHRKRKDRKKETIIEFC